MRGVDIDKTFHDLRGNFVTSRFALGWTREEVAMSSGHSMRNLAMLDVYTDREAASRATAQRINEREKTAGQDHTQNENCKPPAN